MKLVLHKPHEYWNTELPANYLTTDAAYGANGNDPIEQIITQKWIASMINGYEGWIEYRRTGFPALKTVSASFNNGSNSCKNALSCRGSIA